MNEIYEKIAWMKTSSFANTILKKAFDEGIKINFVELSYLIFLVQAKLLYKDYESNPEMTIGMLNENFYRTSKGPFLPSLAFYFRYFYQEQITDYIYFDESNYFTIGTEYDLEKTFHSVLDEVLSSYEFLNEKTLELELRGNYPSAFSITGNEEIETIDILNDEIILQKKLLKDKKRKNRLIPRQ